MQKSQASNSKKLMQTKSDLKSFFGFVYHCVNIQYNFWINWVHVPILKHMNSSVWFCETAHLPKAGAYKLP